MALVGSYVGLSKQLVLVFPIFLLAWLRFGIGAVAMLHWLRKPAEEPALDAPTKRLLFLESFLGNFLFSICMQSQNNKSSVQYCRSSKQKRSALRPGRKPCAIF